MHIYDLQAKNVSETFSNEGTVNDFKYYYLTLTILSNINIFCAQLMASSIAYTNSIEY